MCVTFTPFVNISVNHAFVNFAQAYLLIWALEWPFLRIRALVSRQRTEVSSKS